MDYMLIIGAIKFDLNASVWNLHSFVCDIFLFCDTPTCRADYTSSTGSIFPLKHCLIMETVACVECALLVFDDIKKVDSN